MATVADAVTDSLSRIGAIAADETPVSGDMAKGFAMLNTLTDAWGVERFTIPYILRTTATLTANQTSFTVGTGGNVNIVRPVSFTGMAFIDTSQSPNLEIPIRMLTDDEYRLIGIKSQTSTLPSVGYYNPTYASGMGTLYPWPIPTTTTLQWVLYAPVAVPQFASTATSLVVPPGYYEFIVTNLAYKLCAPFRVPVSTRQEMKEEAQATKQAIKDANWRMSDLQNAAGGMFGGSGYWDLDRFLTGP